MAIQLTINLSHKGVAHAEADALVGAEAGDRDLDLRPVVAVPVQTVRLTADVRVRAVELVEVLPQEVEQGWAVADLAGVG